MLNTSLLHPEILKILAISGHHSLVLIADGNYPAATKRGAKRSRNIASGHAGRSYGRRGLSSNTRHYSD